MRGADGAEVGNHGSLGWARMVQEKGCDGVVAPDAERFGTIGAELTMLKLVADWGTLARAECIGWQ